MSRDTIRIRDLANPVLTDLQRQAIASAPPVVMSEQAVLGAARVFRISGRGFPRAARCGSRLGGQDWVRRASDDVRQRCAMPRAGCASD
jgi:hypothetical protein